MSQTEEQKTEVFTLVQKFLKNPPVIIWGSGATIPYGLPSMDNLKQCLKLELRELKENANLETELGKIDSQDKIDKIKKLIRDEVFKKDLECLKKSIQNRNFFKAIVDMIKKFYDAHPRKIDIVTTNYDCVLEYALSNSGYNFTDGFTGRALARFKQSAFGKENIINLIKVHGSLNWFFDENKNIFYLPSKNNFNKLKYAMVLPARKNKYYETFEEPYRTLIAKSDSAIEQASSFLVVGFGFSDEHLTPKIDNKIKEGIPIVIITKKATDSCRKKLSNSDKYCLFEKNENETKVTFKIKKDSNEKTILLKKNYWELNYFIMEVL